MEFQKAHTILTTWKGESYTFGCDVLEKTGDYAAGFGKKALLVFTSLGSERTAPLSSRITSSLESHGVGYTSILGARPNTPREDVYRIAAEIAKICPDVVVAIGGGSTIDAVKCASVLATYTAAQVRDYIGTSEALASTVEPFFGTGTVTKLIEATGKTPYPVIAVQTMSSSGAHLTKYANVTDPETSQKKLVIDPAIVPQRAVFDYAVTCGAPRELTIDGALDGMSHLWEVFMGATGNEYYPLAENIAAEGIKLIVTYLPQALKDLHDLTPRIALGYGTDLGGYAIMIGSTNGGHLGSFSLVDVLPHGRACAILNIYYTVLFSPVIQNQLRVVGNIFKNAGFITEDIAHMEGRTLGECVMEGMIRFLKSFGYPTTLSEAGATESHLARMITAAKNPQLESKLKSMPVPMDPSKGDIETYMIPLLNAAFTGYIHACPSYRV